LSRLVQCVRRFEYIPAGSRRRAPLSGRVPEEQALFDLHQHVAGLAELAEGGEDAGGAHLGDHNVAKVVGRIVGDEDAGVLGGTAG